MKILERARELAALAEKTIMGKNKYSLWTSPPESWKSPVVHVTDLAAKVSRMDVPPAEDDEQTRPFKTVVTLESLMRPIRRNHENS